MESLSNNLKRLRRNANLTQKEISALIEVKQNTYDSWENRNIEPSAQHLLKMAAIHGITVDELLKGCNQAKAIPLEDKIGFKILTAPKHIREAIYALLEK